MMLRRIAPWPLAKRPFDLFAFFEGRTAARGAFEDRFGRLRRSFAVEIAGTRQDGVLTLEEDFVYSDGTTGRRVWRLEKTGEDTFKGACEDALSEAKGHIESNHCSMSYRMKLDIGSRQIAVEFKDVFYPLDNDTMVNRATVTKFGCRLGQAIIVFSKR
jgi:hypothetical protein